jgi:uncharacterized protein (DUF934 family)
MNFLSDDPPTDGTLSIDNAADVTALGDALRTASAVTLNFPKWTDGRAYSQARLLRSRLGFAGTLVATGDVLVDMLPLLQRCGFDAVRLREDQDPAAARLALGSIDGHYQADLMSKLPHFAREARA